MDAGPSLRDKKAQVPIERSCFVRLRRLRDAGALRWYPHISPRTTLSDAIFSYTRCKSGQNHSTREVLKATCSEALEVRFMLWRKCVDVKSIKRLPPMNTPSPQGLLRKKVTNVSGLNRYCHEQNSSATTLPRTEDTGKNSIWQMKLWKKLFSADLRLKIIWGLCERNSTSHYERTYINLSRVCQFRRPVFAKLLRYVHCDAD